MKAAVFGSWHLASVYTAGLLNLGHEIELIVPEGVKEKYEEGKPPVYEPGLEEEIAKGKKEGRFLLASSPEELKTDTEVCFFAEDCKVTKEGIDIEAFRSLFDEVASSGRFKIIAISSQLPLGTSRVLEGAYPDIRIAYFPEFLRLGAALKLFLEPDYIVLGGEKDVTARVLEFFSAFNCPKFEVTLEEAEMAKHAANIFVAMSVSFVSELTKFSERFNVNLEKVGEIMRKDKRIGPKAYVMPGMGFSGETVERDIRVLLDLAKKLHIDLPMFREVIEVNNEHNLFIEKRLRERFKDFSGTKIGFLGATYKPFTSTLRGSIFAPLMEKLAKEGANVTFFDPHVKEGRFLVSKAEDVFYGADAVVISVNKPAFKEIDYGQAIKSMKGRIIIDAANLLALDKARVLGIDYHSIGRGNI